MKLQTKRLRVLTFYKPNWPVPYIVFSFQLPTKVVYPQPEHAKVLCRKPIIGQYLNSDINGHPLPYIDFLPLGRTTAGTHCFTRIARVRLNVGHLLEDEEQDEDLSDPLEIGGKPKRKSAKEEDVVENTEQQSKVIIDWNLDCQPVVLMERGVVFGIVHVCLNKEYLVIESDATHPIKLKGAFEST